ncbi:ADP-ribosylation factor-like protein 6-interacting protein 6 isoform X4 [Solenopsis invicta]|uniref:ADP-ribosylation factor-like protein 6-interacting protein 6 isoform X4 n=1 Tax=Solenopsis invicta TaxID=13686 RepID=UPI00193C89F4|nr:ADP-ribosylation factor-like protein 6-interacting protein 6 isoform X4 [Solenopsis invicta]
MGRSRRSESPPRGENRCRVKLRNTTVENRCRCRSTGRSIRDATLFCFDYVLEAGLLTTMRISVFGGSLRAVASRLSDSGKFLNASNQYAEVATDVLATFYGKYGWLLKATMSGLVITGFTWFILYKDSSEPGVNPPSPFSPSKQRIRGSSRIQINYLVGVLNGILCFVYMCL